MRKYKVLLVGGNQRIIGEFFTYMDYEFECLSTSGYYDDIKGHIKYFVPNVIVYCFFQEKLDDIKRLVNVAVKIVDHNIPLVILGDAEECTEFTQMGASLRPLVLHRPIAHKEIAKAIISMLKQKEEEKQQAEKDAASMSVEDILSSMEGVTKKHILIVDDDSRVLRLLKDYLAERYEVATAINGKVALKFLETKTTDLMLLDYEMPLESGASILQKIRADERTKDLPVIFLTGVTDKNKIREVLALKPNGYLLKPIDVEKLASTIKGILD